MWTLDADTRRGYVHGITRLGVWYARLLLERGEVRAEDLPIALSRRVDLFRFTDLWNGVAASDRGTENPEWMRLATEIAGWLRETPMAQIAALEERVLGRLEPALERRLPLDVGPPPVRPFACWTYELGWVGMADGPGRLSKLRNPAHRAALLRQVLRLPPLPSRDGVLHIMNVKVPRSLFDDLPGLGRSLRALVADVRAQQPQVRELWCNTWLNEHPKFREIFPEAWFRSGTVASPGNHRNWWGQFARRDGGFNEALATKFRASGGVFPYRALLCHASLEEIDRHLEEKFAPM